MKQVAHTEQVKRAEDNAEANDDAETLRMLLAIEAGENAIDIWIGDQGRKIYQANYDKADAAVEAARVAADLAQKACETHRDSCWRCGCTEFKRDASTWPAGAGCNLRSRPRPRRFSSFNVARRCGMQRAARPIAMARPMLQRSPHMRDATAGS